MSSFSKSVTDTVKSVCAGSQAVSDLSHRASAKLESVFTKPNVDTSVIQVVGKLKSLKEYKNCKESELSATAQHLVSEEELFCEFCHLLDLTSVVMDGTRERHDRLVNLLEVNAAKERMQMRFDQAAMLKLTVCLRPLAQ